MLSTDMVKGVGFKMGWRFKEDDVPIDLTGYSVLIQIREYPWSTEVFGSWEAGVDPQIAFDPTDGAVDFELSPEDVNTLTEGTNFCRGVIDCLVSSLGSAYRSPTYEINYHLGVSRNDPN